MWPLTYIPRFINQFGMGTVENFHRIVQERLELLEERRRQRRLAGTEQASTRNVGILTILSSGHRN